MTTPEVSIGTAPLRTVVRIAGRVSQVEVEPREGPSQLIARVDDGTGFVDIVFMGRRLIPGVWAGQRMAVEGRIVDENGAPRMYNPRYELENQA